MCFELKIQVNVCCYRIYYEIHVGCEARESVRNRPNTDRKDRQKDKQTDRQTDSLSYGDALI